jgi:signal transduction histidine kinase
MWVNGAESPRIWMNTPNGFRDLIAPASDLALQVTAVDADGSPLAGDTALPAGSLTLTSAETRLPFVLRVAAREGGNEQERSRRALVAAGLVGTLLMILMAGYGLYRATWRELLLARQQSDFVSAVSHEFRTPLTSMRHLTDLLVSRGVTSDERRSQYYELLARETERLQRLVETLLSFGRLEAGAYAFHMETLDVSQLVRSVVDEFRREPLARSHDISSRLGADLDSLNGDRETLSRALWNLLENAAKYSDPGTPIQVVASRHEREVMISVTDQGCGIAEVERGKVFQKFVRGADAKRAGIRGVGIGLALVKRIVDAHGGSIRLDSEVGTGSTFTMVLPLVTGGFGVRSSAEVTPPATTLADARSLEPEV